MKWLLWKDYRNNRMVVIAALVFLLAPYLGALIVSCLQVFRWHEDSQVWGENFAGASVLSLIVSQLSIALIGGNAIAGERVDRSAEFQASLPISRKTILCSKLLLALAIVVVIWVTDATTLICLSNRPRGFTAQETVVLPATRPSPRLRSSVSPGSYRRSSPARRSPSQAACLRRSCCG